MILLHHEVLPPDVSHHHKVASDIQANVIGYKSLSNAGGLCNELSKYACADKNKSSTL